MRQGNIFSPDLFNLFNDAIPRKRGFIINGCNLHNVRYGDYTLLIAVLDRLVEECEKKMSNHQLQEDIMCSHQQEKKNPRNKLRIRDRNIKLAYNFQYFQDGK